MIGSRLRTGLLYSIMTLTTLLLVGGTAWLVGFPPPARELAAPAPVSAASRANAVTAIPAPPTSPSPATPIPPDHASLPAADEPAPPDPAAPVDAAATPTPRAAGTAPRVGVQVGHWKTEELPDELARLRNSTGTSAGGYTELQVNLDVSTRLAALLEAEGVSVDVLPATVPPGYDADAFVSIHADGSSDTTRNGFKLATAWRTSPASRMLHDLMRAEYAAATGMVWDDAITTNMRGYYAFSYTRYTHAITRTTPAVIVEMGFLTNPADRQFITTQPDLIAQALANGILRYLRERDPNDGGALIPPEPTRYLVQPAQSVPIYAAPNGNSGVIFAAPPDTRITSFSRVGDWHEVFVRAPEPGNERVIGWVWHADLESRTTQEPAQ
ncbi:MAG: N-acetylmuramoyl-L-alanine amidase [Chloroflexaceae bacterium]|nr:N-acetylmuramoyl-L-alanine amidase [Chloroflexaceae bacterium]